MNHAMALLTITGGNAMVKAGVLCGKTSSGVGNVPAYVENLLTFATAHDSL